MARYGDLESPTIKKFYKVCRALFSAACTTLPFELVRANLVSVTLLLSCSNNDQTCPITRKPNCHGNVKFTVNLGNPSQPKILACVITTISLLTLQLY